MTVNLKLGSIDMRHQNLKQFFKKHLNFNFSFTVWVDADDCFVCK